MSTSVSSLTSNFFPEAENGFTTTTAGSVGSGAGTVTLNSVSGYTNGAIAVFVIDPTDVAKKQTFTGVIDTAGVQVTSVVWTAGTNQTHALGATVVDYATATHISMMSKGLLVSHDQDGTMIDSLPLTTPRITTAIHDANGNEVIKTPATASAVNEITVTNAATTVAPSISATGGDTNINLALTPKGTGVLYADSFYSWQRGTGTWTYVSATTFTVPQADANLISKGTKLWFTQTTSKYFYVASISGTTVTIITTSDYTLANAAITAPFFSNATTPIGFPTFLNYTPTLTNLTIGNGTSAGRYTLNGTKLNARVVITFGSTTTMGTAPKADFPTTATTYTSNPNIGICRFVDTGTAGRPGIVFYDSSARAGVYALDAGSTYLGESNITSTIPHTWANTDILSLEYTVEIA